jgi:hypothetical protein
VSSVAKHDAVGNGQGMDHPASYNERRGAGGYLRWTWALAQDKCGSCNEWRICNADLQGVGSISRRVFKSEFSPLRPECCKLIQPSYLFVLASMSPTNVPDTPMPPRPEPALPSAGSIQLDATVATDYGGHFPTNPGNCEHMILYIIPQSFAGSNADVMNPSCRES